MRRGDPKPVLVSLYEMGRRRSGYLGAPPRRVNQQQSSHDHHADHRRATASGGGVYDRKAELLKYSQRLRALARSDDLRPAIPPRPPHHSKQERKVVPIQVKRESSRILACFRDRKRELPQANKEGNKWKLLQKTGDFKTSSIARRLTVKRKRLVSKLVKAVQKRRTGVHCACIRHHLS